MFSPNPAPSTAGSGYTRARTPQGGMSPTALSALFPTAMTGEGLTATEVASQMVAKMTSGMSKQGTKDIQFSTSRAKPNGSTRQHPAAPGSTPAALTS